MKKKIYAVVLCALMCVVMCVPVLADEPTYKFAGSAETLNSMISEPFDSSYVSMYVSWVYTPSGNGLEIAYFVPRDSVAYLTSSGHYEFLSSSGSRVIVQEIQALQGKPNGNPGYYTIVPPEDSDSIKVITPFHCTVKLFNSYANAKKYVDTGEIDGLISDASAIEYDSNVPAPTEVHIESRYLADEGCPRTTIAFKSSETYESSGMQTEIRYRYSGTFYESGVFGDSKTNRKAFTSPIYKKDLIKTLSVNYVGNTSNNNTVIMNWYDEFMDNDAYKNYAEYKEVEANKHSISWIAAPFNSIEYWIRNVTSDNKASDWVHCKYNYDTGKLEETWTDTVPGGRTDVIDGSIEPGEETPGDIKDSYDIDSSIKNDGGFDTNSSGLISSIKDLFSDNGVVGMVKDILGFMPGWMIAYVSLFFTILIALMILYFVRG